MSVCPFFFFLFVHFPCLSLKLSLFYCCVPPSFSLWLCLAVWPLVNPFLSQLALVEQLKSLLQTRLQLPQSPSLPLYQSLSVVHRVCFSCLTFICPIRCHSLCVHVLFHSDYFTFSLLFWPVAHLFLFFLSVSGLCLFCAHVCPWVLEILMCLALSNEDSR